MLCAGWGSSPGITLTSVGIAHRFDQGSAHRCVRQMSDTTFTFAAVPQLPTPMVRDLGFGGFGRSLWTSAYRSSMRP